MSVRSRLVWKLGVVVMAILTVAIAVSGYVNNLVCARFAQESARVSLRFNSESIVKGIAGQMMGGGDNQESVQELIDEISLGSTVYHGIRYISHHSGEVFASRLATEKVLERTDRACAACHVGDEREVTRTETTDTLDHLPGGVRVLSVMAPIINESRCSTAACHQHADSPTVLGFINADYSLQHFEGMVNQRRILITGTALASLMFAMVALWFGFQRLLARPIKGLIAGTQRIAAGQLDFRFEPDRNDEIGILEESFNTMTAKIRAHRDELRSAMEYLGGMVENSPDIIISVTPEGFIETFNRGAEEALGYGRIEVIGRPIEILFAESRERDVAIDRLKHSGNVQNYETRFLAKNGQVRNVLLTLSYLRDRDGNPMGTMGISKDITQEKELQDELLCAKEYLEGMVEHSADVIITVNSDGLIETFNRGGEEVLGYCRQEVIGRHIECLYADPRDRQKIAKLLRGTGDVKNYETLLRAKDGQMRNVLLTLSHLRDPKGTAIGTIGISKDITQEKKLQRELIQSQKFAAIGQAVTGIQHSIKNMLMSLKGGSYMVRVGMSKGDPQQVEEGRSMIEEGIGRISGLSHNMLNLARDWKPELQRVDLSDLVVSLCELNRQNAIDHGVTLRHEVSHDLAPVLCDPKLIHMAITDILVNAFDACTWKDYSCDETPEVVVKTSPANSDDCLEIEIRDNGCGMSEDIQRSIFTPFFSTKKTLGTGLGLAVTARIIKAHEGEVSVESSPDCGTTFRVHLPTDGPRGH